MAQTVRSILVQSLDNASIESSYSRVGDKIQHPLRIPLIQNLTDALLMFSFDAVNDHFPLAAGASLIIDFNTNQNQINTGLTLGIGTALWVRTIGTPTSGSVYFSGFYARGE